MMKDFQNPVDVKALALRTAERQEQDMYLVGYCPRYLNSDFAKLIDADESGITATVERVNPPPAPVQFRVLCRLEARWPKDFEPFSSFDYLPIVDTSSYANDEDFADLYATDNR